MLLRGDCDNTIRSEDIYSCPLLVSKYPLCEVQDKVALLLDYDRRYEDVWGSGGIFPRILNVGTSWRRVFGFAPQSLYLQEK
jgi:hypothetical protein